ncbi:MAG: putative bifunctional diguanylate cyclase/phosphodiesterase [Candidatus Tyrphobacter sp.]
MRNADGAVAGIAGASFNMTERCTTCLIATALKTEAVRRTLTLAGAVESTRIAEFSFNMDTDTVELTPDLRAIWGFPLEISRVRYADIIKRIHQHDRWRVKKARSVALVTKQPYHVKYRLVRDDGEVRRIEANGEFIHNAREQSISNIGAIRDITEPERARKRSAHARQYDKLTNLLNRSAFIRRVREATRGETCAGVGVVIFDLVKFARINDRLGMAAGDAVLRSTASRLRTVADGAWVLGRTGGDEFACLIPVLNPGDLEQAIAKIQEALEEALLVEGETLCIRGIFGSSVCPIDACDESLVAKASLALNQQKLESASGAHAFRPEMKRMLADRHRLEVGLRGAIERDEFELYLQPIVEAGTGAICAAEALIRWNHAELGVISPNVFLPIAVSAGFMCEIDAWVLRSACRLSAALRRIGVRVSFNLSAAGLVSPKFSEMLDDALRISGASPSNLSVEITEQVLLSDYAQARAALVLLHERGFSIAIDDFGTGYNTLTYLKEFPIDTIKIDRSFVTDLELYPYSRSICSGILALAGEIKLRVVAEGVESNEQLEFLTSHGCSQFQGSLFGMPMPKAEFMSHIYTRRELVLSRRGLMEGNRPA